MKNQGRTLRNTSSGALFENSPSSALCLMMPARRRTMTGWSLRQRIMNRGHTRDGRAVRGLEYGIGIGLSQDVRSTALQLPEMLRRLTCGNVIMVGLEAGSLWHMVCRSFRVRTSITSGRKQLPFREPKAHTNTHTVCSIYRIISWRLMPQT